MAAPGVDKEVGDLGLVQRDVTEGRLFPEAGAVRGPILEDGVAGGGGALDEGGVGDLQRSAEISAEAVSGRSGGLCAKELAAESSVRSGSQRQCQIGGAGAMPHLPPRSGVPGGSC